MPSAVKRYIEELPEDWKLERLNSVAELFGRIGWQGLTSDEYQDEGPWLVTGTDFRNGKINWDSCVHISDQRWEEAHQIKLRPGDLLITKDGTVGKLAIVENQPGKASLNSGVMRIVSNGHKAYTTKYLYYVLQTDIFKEWFKDINAGASTIQHLFQKDFKHFVFPMPPLEEQKRIVSTLNMECLEVDSILETLDKQADALKRYRASIIHEAVTKGLNPNVPMKPSGIDWIGDIPEKWRLKRIKFMFDTSSGATPEGGNWDLYDGGINWIQSGDLYARYVITETGRTVSNKALSEVSVLKVYKAPFVVMAMYGASVGNVSISNIDACTNQACCVMLPKEEASAQYLFYALMDSRTFLKHKALGGTQPNISQVIIRNHKIPVPSKKEQIAIADYLDTRTAAIDSILETKRKQIDVLKRRRQSLIYEYVTGKRRAGKEI